MSRETNDTFVQQLAEGNNVGTINDAKTDGNATLTTRQGHPITNNQSTRTVGNRGPATLENYQFFEKITHFDRERIPERVVHARGAGAHGYFEAYGTVGDEPISKYTRAKLFQEKGKQTPVFVRFSTVIHGGTSPETLRDPRGFATKFYTEDGNWDLVGNNLRVFFIRDAMKFPDVDSLVQARSGHQSSGHAPHLRLHQPNARSDAHDYVSVFALWNSRQLSHDGRRGRQYLQMV